MTRFLNRAHSQRGSSLLEMMTTLTVAALVGTMGTAHLAVVRRGMQGDGAMRLVMTQVNTARELAVTQRRNMELKFVGTDWVQIVRHDVPAGTTVLTSVRFEGATYRLLQSVVDTPDGFGNTGAIAFGATQTLTFSTEGSLIDDTGSPINGTIFLAVADIKQSQRAVTIMGSTGRVRGYKWNGTGWMRV